jgi:hypothetical protein
MEAICSSETSVDFQRTTQCYIPEDSPFDNQRGENLKPYILHFAPLLPFKTNTKTFFPGSDHQVRFEFPGGQF